MPGSRRLALPKGLGVCYTDELAIDTDFKVLFTNYQPQKNWPKKVCSNQRNPCWQ